MFDDAICIENTLVSAADENTCVFYCEEEYDNCFDYYFFEDTSECYLYIEYGVTLSFDREFCTEINFRTTIFLVLD